MSGSGTIRITARMIAALAEFHSGGPSLEQASIAFSPTVASPLDLFPAVASRHGTARHRATESLPSPTKLKILAKQHPARIPFIRIVDAALRQLDIRDFNSPVALAKIRAAEWPTRPGRLFSSGSCLPSSLAL
jgi:hypothetical protein